VKIPFNNLKLQYESIKDEVNRALADVFQGGQFIGGDPVRNFESAFSNLLHVNHCIGTGNGTDSLFIILKSLQIGPGDEVITPAFGCIPSSEVISLACAKPVFAEVDPIYYTLDPEDVQRKITSRTKAIIAVHLYGQAAPVDQLKKICEDQNIILIEDCAQAHLTDLAGKPAGTWGIASAFSFYPTKNLGAYGDAGCIVTQNALLAETMRRFANHGALQKEDHQFEGTNSRLDTLQAAILSIKLNYLKQWNEQRRVLARHYQETLKSIDSLVLPRERPESTHTFHLFGIRTPYRDSLKKYLAAQGIETLIHYPKGLPYTDAYAQYHAKPEDFPVTYELQNQILSLPLYPGLSNDQIQFIAESIRRYFS
jgi:dTDP-4-amino-4,6-dideoxygalactose transaminase